MRLSKTVDEEGSRREKEKSKHDEKREERRKQRETPSSLSVVSKLFASVVFSLLASFYIRHLEVGKILERKC